jgi:hypothetical protein
MLKGKILFVTSTVVVEVLCEIDGADNNPWRESVNNIGSTSVKGIKISSSSI